MSTFVSKVESLKVVIDLLGLDIENLVPREKREAIEALENSVLSLIEGTRKASENKKSNNEVRFTCETCGQHFSKTYRLNNHKRKGKRACDIFLKRKHENEEGILACTECNYRTNSKHCGTFKHVGGHKLLYACTFFFSLDK